SWRSPKQGVSGGGEKIRRTDRPNRPQKPRSRWRAINLTVKSRKKRWSRPARASATLAKRALPDIVARMGAALKGALAYWVLAFRGAARLAFRAACIRAR